MTHEFIQWLDKVYPLILNRTLNRADTILEIGQITIYSVGTIIRIDIKPK